jgi:predicted O-methyltransferase YrrM
MRDATATPTQSYIERTFAQEDDLLRNIRTMGEGMRPGMMVSASEGKMLHTFAHMIGAKHILEIGTFVGYSTVWLARALPEDGQLTTLEFDAHHAQLAQGFFAKDTALASRITLMEGAALTSLEKLSSTITTPFDLIFIDAAKSEYHDYLLACEPMLRKGGLVIGDNSLLFGALAGEPWQRTSQSAIDAMTAFNARLGTPELYTGILFPTQEGLTVAVKNF